MHEHASHRLEEASPKRTWSDAEREIMQATYRAMVAHGYSGLSIAKIADELGKTKSSVYYHYDSKEDLLVSFLDFVVDQFQRNFTEELSEDPGTALDEVIERLIPEELPDERFHGQVVLLELRSETSRNEAFRDRFTAINDLLVETISTLIERGIETGVFRDVDPSLVAEHIVATANGVRIDRVTTDRGDAPRTVRTALTSYVDAELRGETSD